MGRHRTRRFRNSFALIVVLFILLIIIGAIYMDRREYC